MHTFLARVARAMLVPYASCFVRGEMTSTFDSFPISGLSAVPCSPLVYICRIYVPILLVPDDISKSGISRFTPPPPPSQLRLIRLASAVSTSPRQNETAILAKWDRAARISSELTSQVVSELPGILV